MGAICGPDFVGIGPSRCGTTTIYEALRAHPDVWLPPLKELHYWDDQRGRGRINRRSLGHATWLRRLLTAAPRQDRAALADVRFFIRYLTGARTDDWYRSLFGFGGDRLVGEITPAYCTLAPAQVELVCRELRHTRFILVLRDPIERAWSSATKILARSRDRGIDQVDDEDLSRHFASPSFAARSDYVGMLTRWEGVAGRERLHVGFFDEMIEDADRFAGELAGSLGIDAAPLVDFLTTTKAYNSTSRFRSAVPERWERRLAARFVGPSAELAARVGGPSIRWHERMERALSSGAR